MPRYYCDYCDTYLTHDSPSVRKQHNAGYKHKANVRSYYQQFEEQQTQSLIDQRIKEHLGQAAAFQVGATFNQHLLSIPGNMPRPRLPVLPPPVLPMGASQAPMTAPLIPGIRPPVLPTPVGGAPGYSGAPAMPPTVAPGATSMPMQVSALPRPPTLPPPTSGAPGVPAPNNSAPLGNPAMYQANPPPAAGTSYDAFGASTAAGLQGAAASGAPATAAASQTGFSYSQSSEGNH